MNLVKQKIETQYIDLAKLSRKLSELFPGVKCKIVADDDDDDDFTIIYAPRKLTEEEKISVFKEETK